MIPAALAAILLSSALAWATGASAQTRLNEPRLDAPPPAAVSDERPPGLRDGPSLLASGSDKFLAGDLAAAADDWASAHAVGQKNASELAVLAFTILAKEAVRTGDFLAAALHSAHGLEVSPRDPVLERLLRWAEKDRRARGRGRSEQEVDSSGEQERLVGRVLKLDVSNPRLSPDTGSRRESEGSQGLLRQLLEEDKSFDLEGLLKSLHNDEEVLRAADRARLSQAWRRRRGRFSYENGLPQYYAGEFEAAARWFRQALQLDPGLDAARAGLKGCEAALGKPPLPKKR